MNEEKKKIGCMDSLLYACAVGGMATMWGILRELNLIRHLLEKLVSQ